MGKSTINGDFPWFFVCLPEGKSRYPIHIIPAVPGLHLAWALALSPSSSSVKSAVEQADLALRATKAGHGGQKTRGLQLDNIYIIYIYIIYIYIYSGKVIPA